jgi:very-short-patch-repair endonuclease
LEDKQRTKWLESQGFIVLRFWDNDILNNIEGVLFRIAEARNNRSPSPTPLPSRERENVLEIRIDRE